MITISNRRASIENVQSLQSVNENKMEFLLKDKKMILLGKYLRVVMFTVEEIWIDGDIEQVIFDEK